jgi:hypothetical protein
VTRNGYVYLKNFEQIFGLQRAVLFKVRDVHSISHNVGAVPTTYERAAE